MTTVYLDDIDWLKGCNKCRPHNHPIYWLFRWLLRLSLAVVPEHRWTVSERCVYQSLLTCGMTLPHQSRINFDYTGVLPPVRVICSGSFTGVWWFCGQILLEGNYRMYFLSKMFSSLCKIWRWEIKHIGAILDFSVRIGVQVAHGQTVLQTTTTVLSTSPGSCMQDCMRPVVA